MRPTPPLAFFMSAVTEPDQRSVETPNSTTWDMRAVTIPLLQGPRQFSYVLGSVLGFGFNRP